MKINAYIFSLFMFIAMILVVMPTMPHHHHSDRMICMKDDVSADDCCSSRHTPHHHPSDDPCCTDSCYTQIINAESGREQIAPTEPFHIQKAVFTAVLLSGCFTLPDGIVHYRDYVYIEALHGIAPAYAASPRAPPFVLSI